MDHGPICILRTLIILLLSSGDRHFCIIQVVNQSPIPSTCSGAVKYRLKPECGQVRSNPVLEALSSALICEPNYNLVESDPDNHYLL